MSLDILCIRSNIFFQRYSDHNLISWVILVNDSLLLSYVFPNWHEVLPMSLDSSLGGGEVFLPNRLEFRRGFDTFDLLVLSNPSLSLFSWVPINLDLKKFVLMRLNILCIQSNLILIEVFRYQNQVLGDIRQYFCTFSQHISNCPKVLPMSLNAL